MTEALDRVSAYLRALAQERSVPVFPEESHETYPFVTISRQTGAGGHTLANMLLSAMDHHPDRDLFSGWFVLDSALCQTILNDADLRVSLESLLSEESQSRMETMVYNLIGGETLQDKVHQRIAWAIRTLTYFGKVIVIGWGSACLTASVRKGVRVRLVAPLDERIRRMQDLQHVTAEEARHLVESRDHSRHQFVQRLYQRDVDDPLLYDAVWNTGHVPLADVADWVLRMVNARFERRSPLQGKLL